MSDPGEDRQNDQRKGTPGYDHLFRVRPLMESIKYACRAYYHPHQLLSIDERMVPSKTRNGMKQYMKAKHTKWGFKLFVLADPKNGYTCDFNIYCAYTGETVERRIQNTQDNSWSRRKVPVPTALTEYNKFMGGVDLSDALVKCHNVEQKTKKWYKTIFHHFVGIAVVNGYILHKELAQQRNAKLLTQKSFREDLCKQLVDFKPGRAPVAAAPVEAAASEEAEGAVGPTP
ncbi:hypothetical protein SKAU_G00134280 [Synaphobranchus kaupii]|uniref:PiggyBac transposable element-derived protein domain-containing protein n=1 Tax=Synaphobranchus kaupii TaxID=118154 RepID=A0A9Q1FR46_SYNKA|nr:hypothetical protein SKAU_G00134280 [Synaphobranchus kaupii]